MRGDEHLRFRIFEHVAESLVGVFEVERCVGGACFVDGEDRQGEFFDPVEHDTDEVVGLHAKVDESVCQRVGQAVHLAIGELAVSVDDSKYASSVKRELRNILGDQFRVKDRIDQKPLYYKIFHSERLGVFLILSLIVLISALNLIASLSLLIINKRKDIATFRSMGMEVSDIRRIFFKEGVLIATIGVVAGIVIGFVICVLQQHFGIVKLGGNAVVDAFPVAMRLIDFVATFIVVSLLSTFVVLFTVRRARYE